MTDYLQRFSGPYEKKVESLMRMMRAKVEDSPRDEHNLALNSKHMLLNQYDYTTSRMHHRISATTKFRQKAHSQLQDLISTKEIDSMFAFSNGMILACGYNETDRSLILTFTAVIWVLDQLSLQGNLEKTFPFLPELTENELLLPCVQHPQYDRELILSMLKLFLLRNGNASDELHLNESTLVCDTEKSGDLRSNFDAVIALLDQSAIDIATKKYEEKVWEFYRLILPAYSLVESACDNMRKELETLQNFSSPTIPLCMVQTNIVQFPKTSGKTEEVDILRLKLQKFEDSCSFTQFGLPNSREKTAKLFSEILGEQRTQQIINFSVDDPFEMAFALFYLLDSGSDIPWLYYGSICVADTLVDQLPFNTPTVVDGARCLQPELTRAIYSHRFSGYRWEEENDCCGEPVQREKATNLAQLLYANAQAVYPRITNEIPQIDRYFEDMGLENEREKEAYRLLLYAIQSGNNRSESLRAYWSEQQMASEVPEIAVEKEDSPALQERIQFLVQRNASLRTAFHEETELRKRALLDLQRTKDENKWLRRELADLRELVFSQQTESTSLTETECAVKFPVTISSKIVSVGGHPSWIREMKALLPNVIYFPAEVMPNKDILRSAHEVWVQTQYISHASFYRIISALGQKTQLRYFSSKGAHNCAVQLISAERNLP